MSFTYVPTSELEAVNTMITSIGLSPISSLDTTGHGHVVVAKDVFHKTNRAVQAEGWHFNSESKYPLTPDGNDKVAIPGSALRIDGTRGYNPNSVIAARGDYLYDKYNHQWTFSGTVYVDIVWFLEFTDLPEAARYYITMVASRKYQTQILGSAEMHGFTEQDEMKARILMEQEEANTADHNIFTGSLSMLSMTTRDQYIG